MNDAYIGITGFTTETQVQKLSDLIPKNFSRKLMIGLLVSYGTLNGEIMGGRFVQLEKIKQLFDTSEAHDENQKNLNFIHYCDPHKIKLSDSLKKITDISGKNLHGFQLNMRWPDPKIISNYKNHFPNKKFVIQMEKGDFLEYSPQKMALRLTQYQELCEYVILDMSMGSGKQMLGFTLMKYAEQIKEKTKMNIVFAGGLHYQNLDIIKPILEKFPDMSIDAEGRLLDLKDTLDLHLARAYILKALSIF
ncbi:MAG: hypothetical protein PHH83_01895 [Patescibacteria group bacterium]|nr:hypothetical protein [Patescibacteria group bacterium]